MAENPPHRTLLPGPKGIGIGLLLAIGLGLVLSKSENHEPIYKGQPLSKWLNHHVPSSAAIPPYGSDGWNKADLAIRSIGTNGLATLLVMIRAKDPPPVFFKLLRILEPLPWVSSDYHSAVWRNEEAEYAFEILGSKAASATPELIRIYQENVTASSQRCAALALGHIGREARAAIPVLIPDFSHPDRNVRFYAVSAVADIGGEPDIVLPALTRALKDEDVSVRWNALVGLSSFGARGRPLVPEVLTMLNDPGMVGDSSITQQVQTTLWRIAPESVGKPELVEASSPITSNDITVEALKVVFDGSRKTLIPPGRKVPAVAQYWRNDPRPGLTLYRGKEGIESGDYLLGHFEVMGPEDSESMNVSTICVIADHKVFLCARDNNRGVYLQIRRVQRGESK